MLNLGQLVSEQAKHAPGRVAMRMGEKAWSYGELNALAGRVAAYLRSLGLEPGDKVALGCPNLPFFPIVYYGILQAGLVAVPLNVLFKPREIAYHLQDSGARAYFVFEGTPELPMAAAGKAGFDEASACEHFVVITADPAKPGPIDGAVTLGRVLAEAEPLSELAQTEPDDTAVILYTSGTTGRPKGAELSHLNMVMNAMVSNQLFEVPGQDSSEHVFLAVLPLFHSFGQTCVMNATFYGGGQISLLPRFDARQALQLVLAHRINRFAGVPTMYWALLNEAARMEEGEREAMRASLKLCASGGAAMPVELMKNFERAFDVPILEGYGLSETSPVASFNQLSRPRKIGTIGQAIWGVDIRIVDTFDREVARGESGEIVIRGHNVMKGYYRRPEETAQALRGGWFHTGDIGTMDEEGYITVVDRLKDMIIRGGFNVYPREVEEVLITHPAVSLAAVVGVPDEEHGEEIRGYVVLAEGQQAAPEEIVAWCKAEMAAHKYPRRIEIRDSLPMNATGKILRRELREEAGKAVAG